MICFDLEGPLSPQDNAYEVMKLAENGDKVFETLSEYDDVLALKGKRGYEPGDTLKLIIPFLIYYGITEGDIKGVSEKAALVSGMKETVQWIRDHDLQVRVISTSYQQHAHTIGQHLDIKREEIASTRLELKDLSFDQEIMESLGDVESKILSEGLTEETTRMLDELYFSSGLFDRVGVEVVGGQRKVDALLAFAEEAGKDIREVAAVGDSITDYKMLEEVKKGGGLAIAFNANQYCLPYASVAVATMDGRALIPVIEGFMEGGRRGGIKKVEELENDLSTLKGRFNYLLEMDPKPHYASLERENVPMENVLRVHKEMRMKVRGEAGKLG